MLQVMNHRVYGAISSARLQHMGKPQHRVVHISVRATGVGNAFEVAGSITVVNVAYI